MSNKECRSRTRLSLQESLASRATSTCGTSVDFPTKSNETRPLHRDKNETCGDEDVPTTYCFLSTVKFGKTLPFRAEGIHRSAPGRGQDWQLNNSRLEAGRFQARELRTHQDRIGLPPEDACEEEPRTTRPVTRQFFKFGRHR